jgi:hypothetical protein
LETGDLPRDVAKIPADGIGIDFVSTIFLGLVSPLLHRSGPVPFVFDVRPFSSSKWMSANVLSTTHRAMRPDEWMSGLSDM